MDLLNLFRKSFIDYPPSREIAVDDAPNSSSMREFSAERNLKALKQRRYVKVFYAGTLLLISLWISITLVRSFDLTSRQPLAGASKTMATM